MNYIKSGFLKLNRSDVIKGIIVAVAGTLLGALQQALIGHGLDFGSYDWGTILDVSWKAGLAYLFKNLLSDSNGKVLGKIG